MEWNAIIIHGAGPGAQHDLAHGLDNTFVFSLQFGLNVGKFIELTSED